MIRPFSSTSWSLLWTCSISSVLSAPSFAVLPKIIPVSIYVMGRRGAAGILQGTAVLLCTFVSQTSHCLQVRCKAVWARCQSGVSHKIPCSTSSTRPRLLAEPGAVQYNTESRCPLNSVRVAVKETEELGPFTFPQLLAHLLPKRPLH